MFSASFLLIASAYDALPAQMPVLRIPSFHILTAAPKSPFIAFRVPLMNLTHGLIAAVMLSHATDFSDEQRRASYFAFFSTLLFAIALKSDFEALEISRQALTLGPIGQWLTYGTAVSVVGGLAIALFRGRNVPIPWPELQLCVRDKILLGGLFVSYLAMAAQSLLVSSASRMPDDAWRIIRPGCGNYSHSHPSVTFTPGHRSL